MVDKRQASSAASQSDRQPRRTVATAIAAFLAEHHLSPGSRRVYAGALRVLQDQLGADTVLTMLDEERTAEQLACWFQRRYGQTAPATRVRQLAILRSACAFWRGRAWRSTDPGVVKLIRATTRCCGP